MSKQGHSPGEDDLRLFVDLLERVARSRGLSPEDVKDFVQSVHVRLLETNYGVFRQFEGQSSLRTYLTVVATRLLKDWQNHAWGKWRASAAATRLGPLAIHLEQLVVRDGLTSHEAVQSLRSRPDSPPTRDLRHLIEQLPTRHRRRLVTDEVLAELPGQGFDDPVLAREQQAVERRRRRLLRTLLASLPEQDRQMLEARYLRQVRVPVVARSLGHDPKFIYRRCDRLLRTLRARLTAGGIVGSTN